MVRQSVLVGEQQEAQLAIVMAEEREASMTCLALKPETLRAIGESEVALSVHGKTLLVDFRAETVSGLRALINSYLRWVTMVSRTLEVVDAERNGPVPAHES
jgi:tRNA threonylcarbamoyladenosine modification (KEOPS) complex  Pcc1 subunit